MVIESVEKNGYSELINYIYVNDENFYSAWEWAKLNESSNLYWLLVQTIYNPFSWKPCETHFADEENWHSENSSSCN